LDVDDACRRAAEAIGNARALVITAGAGMGVDSGLPDFRGERGFWNAYPVYERLGLSFVGAANPAHFESDPAFGWGFYGHRARLYRETEPHEGFRILSGWIERLGIPHFVVTSNVDGQFQKAGFDGDRVLEVHGSIHHLQCLSPCSDAIWESREEIPVDLSTMRALRIPRCPRCEGVARPNVLMFGDFSWIGHRTEAQERLFGKFLEQNPARPTAVVEMGAGTSIPTIRNLGERLGRRGRATVVRINPREPWIDPPHVSIPAGALEGLERIEAFLSGEAGP
jgi:NAD-dependent SIR2 family protein deacetylase